MALYEARPVAGASGRIALACAGCAEGQGDRTGTSTDALTGMPLPAALPAPSVRRRPAAAVLALALAVLLAVLYLRGQVPPRSASAGALHATSMSLAGGALAGQQPGASAPAPAGAEDALSAERAGDSTGDAERPAASPGPGDDELDDHEHGWLADIDPGLFEGDGELRPTIEDMRERSEALEERLPTIADWVFPVLGSEEPFPLKPTRRFGADRDARAPAECGGGHCGVDLDGPRGTPVVAVAWGVVTRLERRSNRSSGKYVRLEHPDYVYTAYMHLDEVADGLEIGDEIRPGDVIGTLGRTGIRHSAPHLHFTLAVPSGNRLVHIDPAPYLGRAERLPAR